MTNEQINELVNRTVEYYKLIADEESWRLTVYTIRELAKGKPVEPARLAELMREPVEKTKQRLENIVEWGDQGRMVVGRGVTLNPTQHEFALEGRSVWVWCAGDAIIFPALIGETARIKSPCAVTGEMIELTVAPDGIKAATPASAAASLVTYNSQVPTTMDAIRAVVCSGQVFFKSAEVADEWHKKHPNTLVLPVREHFEVYKRVFDRMWAGIK